MYLKTVKSSATFLLLWCLSLGTNILLDHVAFFLCYNIMECGGLKKQPPMGMKLLVGVV